MCVPDSSRGHMNCVRRLCHDNRCVEPTVYEVALWEGIETVSISIHMLPDLVPCRYSTTDEIVDRMEAPARKLGRRLAFVLIVVG